MTGRVTKERAKPRKAADPKNEITAADLNLVCAWLCMKNNGGKSINFEAVAAKMNCSVIGAKSRYRRVKERVDFVMDSKELTKDTNSEPASPSKPAKQSGEENPKPKKTKVDELAEDM
ncbi:hypothetical protein F1880_002878 [Penicillium rolfsii]|nr:hypothetical protein F1880_002878 [Penicillium rolfsii]